MSRHQRGWQAFVERALCFREHEELYHGVCFIDQHDRVAYTHGCFRGDDVVIGNNSGNGNGNGNGAAAPPAPLDAAQFRHAFEQHTRIAMQDAANATRATPSSVTIDAVASLRLGAVRFQVVSTSFSSLCAVAGGKTFALVAQRLPFGILVVVSRHPHSVEDIAPLVERCCLALR